MDNHVRCVCSCYVRDCPFHLLAAFVGAHSSSQRVCSLRTARARKTNTHLTPAEKLATGKKSPSVLKFSNMPWTGWPLILKEMLGAPRSRQQLTTSSDVKMCWFREATARGTRPAKNARTCACTAGSVR